MSWVHEGHDIEMHEPATLEPGERFGPYCVTCDEDMRFFVIPSEAALEKAKEWAARNKHKWSGEEDS